VNNPVIDPCADASSDLALDRGFLRGLYRWLERLNQRIEASARLSLRQQESLGHAAMNSRQACLGESIVDSSSERTGYALGEIGRSRELGLDPPRDDGRRVEVTPHSDRVCFTIQNGLLHLVVRARVLSKVGGRAASLCLISQ